MFFWGPTYFPAMLCAHDAFVPLFLTVCLLSVYFIDSVITFSEDRARVPSLQLSALEAEGARWKWWNPVWEAKAEREAGNALVSGGKDFSSQEVGSLLY
jgi:hypothetical protein